MANILKISGPASALLLLAALLAAGARADDDWVTTAECKARGGLARVRQYPVDSDATGLVMKGCNLTGIEQKSLTGLPAVTDLYLSDNKLRELPVFEEHVCRNLTQLLLNDNQLTEINNAGTFSACTKLKILDLHNNQIQRIHPSVFSELTYLRMLALQNNKITYIPDQMFSNNYKLKYLYLDANMITYLPPHFASRLKQAGAGLEVFWFDNNPWRCACLIELLADVRRAGVRDYNYYYNNINKTAYDGAVPVCVYTGTAPCSRSSGLLRAARGNGPA